LPLKISTLAGYTVDQYVRPFLFVFFSADRIFWNYGVLLGDDYRRETGTV
jgi:hypothetical protein